MGKHYLLDKIKKSLSGKSFIRIFAGGVLTQGLLSVTNLFIKAWLARNTTKTEYGIYVMAFATILIFISLQNALVNSPLTVLLPEKKGEARDRFISGLGIGQWLFFLPLCALLLIGSVTYGLINGDITKVMWLIYLVFVIPVVYYREFTRVIYFNYIKITNVMIMDAVFICCAVSGIFALHYINKLSGLNAIIILGVSNFFAAATGRIMRHDKMNFNLEWVRTSFSETLQYSKWAFIGVIASNIQSKVYVYIISSTIGIESTADLDAARLLFMPIGLLLTSSQRIFLVKGSQIRSHEDLKKYKKFYILFLLFFIVIWCFYVLFLYLFKEKIISYVFTDKYLNIIKYLPLWAFFFLILACRFVITYSLQVFKKFKNLAINGVITSLIVLSSCFVFLKVIGVQGALLSLITGEFLLLILSLFVLLPILKNKNTV